jgi:cell division protein FtsQ
MKEPKNILASAVRRRKKLRMLLINVVAVIGAVALFTLLGFVNNRQNHTPCRKLEITIDNKNGQSFLDDKQLREVIMQAEPGLLQKNTGEVNINAIHEALMQIGAVKEARVFVSADGRCIVKLKQRTPLARIINQGGPGFYIDREGFTMPLSSRYTARVPVYTGYISEKLLEKSITELAGDAAWSKSSKLDDIYQLTNFINGNPFLEAQVEHVHITSGGKFEIIPRVGNHRILVGDVTNLETKFKKLMAFYAETVHKADLNDYSVINLEYTGQVVCVKRQ